MISSASANLLRNSFHRHVGHQNNSKMISSLVIRNFPESESNQIPRQRSSKKLLPASTTFSNHDGSGGQALGMHSGTTETLDSDGSFTRGVKRKRKKTRKEHQKMEIARCRRLNHNAILTSCGCSKDCNAIVSKDERVLVHSKFWNLSPEDQRGFIRENVRRTTVQKRRPNRSADDPRKSYTYIFHIRFESGEMRQVCKKFFLNSIGYNDNCG